MNTTDKLTDRKIYTAIAEGTLEDLDIDTVVAWAEKKIAQIDHKAAKAKENAAAKRAEGDALTEAVYEATSTDFETIAAIAARVVGDEVTASRVAYRLNALSKEGKLEKGEVTVKDSDKSRKLVAYRRFD